MNGVWGDRLRAIGVLVLLSALAAGVPYLLLTIVGNPFPSSLPSANELRILLTQNGQGFANFIIGALAVLIWLIWAQLMIALVVEAFATVRRSESRRLPLVPGIQSFAAQLIAALTIATTLTAAPLMTSAAGALDLGPRVEATQASSTQVVDIDALDAPAVAPAQASVITSAPEQASLTLSDPTELWDLAESAYGDGVMWKTIAAANSGRLDAAGQRITETTESVAEGTRLLMPGEVNGEGLSVFGVAADVAVAPGDSMWSLAEDHVEERLGRPATDDEVSQYWSEVVEANPDISSGNADLIYPGEILTLPGTSSAHESLATAGDKVGVGDFLDHQIRQLPPRADTPETGAADAEGAEIASSEAAVPEFGAQPAPVVAEVQAPEVGERQPAPVAEEAAPARPSGASPVTADAAESESPEVVAVGLAALGSALLSLGAVSAIRRRRDLQRRTRAAGAAPRPPSTEAAAFEAAMRHASDELRESELDAGWRALPASTVQAMRQAGPLQIHAEASGVLHAISVTDFDGDTTITPFDLTAQAEVEPEPSGAPVVPTSLIVGNEQSSGEAVLLDLASVAAVCLQGNPVEVRRFARSAIVDLAVSERADDLRVIAVGVGHELIDLDRVSVVDDFAAALGAVKASGHVGDAATPLIVISTLDPGPDASEFTQLGVVVVAPGLDSETQIVLDGDNAEILPAATAVRLAALSDDHYRSVAELVDVTSVSAVEPVGTDVLIEDSVDVPPADECPIAVGPIDVKVLGPVEVEGASSFSSLKAVDVIAYLAFHRNGVDADQIKSWVWPTFEPPTDKALANVMSRARTGLGADDDGEPYLSRAGADRTYRLSPAVTTDFDRFRGLVGLADDDDDPMSQLKLLKRALQLIRGVPFTGGSASSFAWADNHVRAQVEFTIDETVHRCVDLALELGDVSTARWAALKGLELVPGCEQCFRRRFLVASADNNRTELRRAMADLERSAAVDLGEPEAVDIISGDLLDLYHQLDRALVGDAS